MDRIANGYVFTSKYLSTYPLIDHADSNQEDPIHATLHCFTAQHPSVNPVLANRVRLQDRHEVHDKDLVKRRPSVVYYCRSIDIALALVFQTQFRRVI